MLTPQAQLPFSPRYPEFTLRRCHSLWSYGQASTPILSGTLQHVWRGSLPPHRPTRFKLESPSRPQPDAVPSHQFVCQ